MTAVISCTSNTMLDINRPYIGGERWFGIFDATALMISPQASENLHILMPPALINIYICSETIDIVHDKIDLVYIEH